ncbi:hypothetical protein AVEN_208012-1, partial [Araneus ventricosus]
MAITVHGSAPPEGGTHYHWQKGTPVIILPTSRSENPLTSLAAYHP